MSLITQSITGIVVVVIFTTLSIVFYACRRNEFGDREGYTWPVLLSVILILAYGSLGISFVLSFNH